MTRVDADVAIVDTGIAYHPDLNVAGGYNCSTSGPTRPGATRTATGRTSPARSARIDNGFGRRRRRPGARVWGVKILNDDGYGLLSWYVCGLDWILAQRDPKDPSRPLFEAVNMSVTKDGSRRPQLRHHQQRHPPRGHLPGRGGRDHRRRRGRQRHHYASQQHPGRATTRSSRSRPWPTRMARPGGLGGNRCFSWGGYDKDDTFADFSNYGADVDIIAPGKCIWSTMPGPGYAYLSGTSMAAPAVTGAVALYKSSRPNATPAEVKEALRYLGNFNWKTRTDPDSIHEPLLDVSRLGPLGTFDVAAGRDRHGRGRRRRRPCRSSSRAARPSSNGSASR